MSSIYQIPAEMIRAEGTMLPSETHNFTSSIVNRELFSEAFKEFNDVLDHKKCDRTEQSNYKHIPQLFTIHKCSANIYSSWLIPYVEETILLYQRSFQSNGSNI
jgi:hypothetical protein